MICSERRGKEMERGRESAWQSSVQANRAREREREREKMQENERLNQCGRASG